MQVANIDLDGVVYPWHEIFALYVTQINGPLSATEDYDWDFYKEMPYPAPTQWNFQHDWNLTTEEFMSVFRKGVDDNFIWLQGQPLPGAQTALWELSQNDYYIRLVTQRLVHRNNHGNAITSTATWLDKWNIPYHEIIFMGRHSAKSDFKADTTIDDKPEHVQDQIEAGVDAYLLARPWNEDYQGQLPTVYSWDEYVAARKKNQMQLVPAGSSSSQDE